jgi:SAM-dependent methyltransferase
VNPDRLVELEQRFGGYHTGVPWGRVSPHGNLSEADARNSWLTGGDRMGLHGYAPAYAAALAGKSPRVIVELGILRGTGLAMWCELFPDARVIGLDIDPSMFRGNLPDLLARGAFARNEPEVYEFDELAPDAADRLARILGPDAMDLFIDDALHYDEAILGALDYCLEHLSPDGVYFIEDNDQVHQRIFRPGYTVQPQGELTVITLTQQALED